MAKSPTEQIADLRFDFGVIKQRVETLDRDVEEIHADRKADAYELKDLRQQVGLLAQRIDEQAKRYEEWERRRWSLITLLVGAFLSLAASLVVTAVSVIVTLVRK